MLDIIKNDIAKLFDIIRLISQILTLVTLYSWCHFQISFLAPKNSLNWHGWQPLNLLPYSPDYNLIERIWLVMEVLCFNNYFCKSIEQLLQRLDQTIMDVISHP